RLYDLVADPGEKVDLKDAPTEAYAAELAEALGREVVPVWRVALRNGRSVHTSETTLTFPGGVTAAWAAYDPRGEFAGTRISVVDGVVHVVQVPGAELPPALYVRPAGDARNPAGLDLKMTSGKLTVGGVAADGPVAFSRTGTPFLTVGDRGWGATVELVWSPVPTGVAVSGYDEAMRHELEALGYLDP
ncbi:MAG: hypothetical protein H0V89_11550, partial [Deltaproteobacteria bacterium]|nr:hypothetical protein [Deltaproteobacteria bacterium]